MTGRASGEGDSACACIVLHGLGADGSDLRQLAPALWPGANAAWLFPDAPVRAVTINGGMRMRAWHDVRALRLLEHEDREGIEDSSRIVGELIDGQQAAGIDPAKIVLAGFSQGGAIALHAGLRRNPPLGAIVGMSCYLPLAELLAAEAPAATAAVPVFLGAGIFDAVVAPADTAAAAAALRERGHEVEFRRYPVAHGIAPAEIEDIGSFLNAHVGGA